MRRALLSLGALGLAVLSVRRVHADDPSTVSVGGSFSEHDAHLTCGPDVRVRHASGGAHVHKVFGEKGEGFVVDARGGAGTTAVTTIYDEQPNDKTVAATRWVGSGQLAVGYSWQSFGFALGAGYYGAADGAYSNDAERHRTVLPAAQFRFGRGTPFRGEAGFGSPPVPGLARFFSIYTDFELKVDDSVAVGFGTYSTLQTDLERRSGLYGRGVFSLARPVKLGAFVGVETTLSHERRIGFATGLSLTFLLDE